MEYFGIEQYIYINYILLYFVNNILFFITHFSLKYFKIQNHLLEFNNHNLNRI